MTRRITACAGLLSAALLLAACGGGGGDGGGGASGGASGGGKTLKVWTVEDQAERVAAQKQLLAGFTQKTGIQAELTAVSEDQLTTVLTSAAAAGDLPDVIGALSLGGVSRLLTDDLVDPVAAAQIVSDLGESTFAKNALTLTRSGDRQLSVPSDGFANLIYYRKDLFDKAGLQPPTTYEAMTAAAKALNKPGQAGIVAATAPADSFTSQTFEQVALGNGCQLVDNAAKVTLGSSNCAQSFGFYADLIRNYSTKGNQDADTTRATYFAGQAAMVIWSSFLLDELAGLRNDALPTCPQCKADKTWLSKNTGIATTLKGPAGASPTTWGEIVSWAVLKDAATDEAKQLVEYMMSDAYTKWLAIAPEGKVPTRTGTQQDPQSYVKAWGSLQAGVDKKAPLTDFYDAAVLKDITSSVDSFTRWGFPQGQGELEGAVTGQNVVSKAVAGLINSGGDPAATANKAAAEAEQIQKDLGGGG